MLLFITLLSTIGMTHAELSNEDNILRLEQKRHEDMSMLATAIGIPLVSNSQIWIEPLFPDEGVIHSKGFRVEAPGIKFGTLVNFLVYSNAQVIAFGKLFEYPSFKDTRTALISELMNNNTHPKELAEIYRVRTNSVGEFSVVRSKYNDATNETISDSSRIYFIRGAKAISLRGMNGADVRLIAKVIDDLLKRPPVNVVTNSILTASDIDGLKITTSYPSQWGYSLDEKKKTLYVQGVTQAAREGIRLSISYAEFPSVELAHQGIEFHRKTVAAPFTKGIWDGAPRQNIGENTWHGESHSNTSLLFSSQKTCIYIGIYDGDTPSRRRLCEKLALKIIEKINKGGHVIIPAPPPLTPEEREELGLPPLDDGDTRKELPKNQK